METKKFWEEEEKETEETEEEEEEKEKEEEAEGEVEKEGEEEKEEEDFLRRRRRSRFSPESYLHIDINCFKIIYMFFHFIINVIITINIIFMIRISPPHTTPSIWDQIWFTFLYSQRGVRGGTKECSVPPSSSFWTSERKTEENWRWDFLFLNNLQHLQCVRSVLQEEWRW